MPSTTISEQNKKIEGIFFRYQLKNEHRPLRAIKEMGRGRVKTLYLVLYTRMSINTSNRGTWCMIMKSIPRERRKPDVKTLRGMHRSLPQFLQVIILDKVHPPEGGTIHPALVPKQLLVT